MRKNLLFIYCTALLLFILYSVPQKIKQSSRPFNQEYQSRKILIFNHLKSKDLFPYIFAFIEGDKKEIQRKKHNLFKDLGIFHLFTPSGLHFSSILVLLIPLRKPLERLIKKKKIIQAFFDIALGILGLTLNNLYAIQRIGLLRIFGGLNLMTKKPLTQLTLFYIVFFLDFWLGTFNHSHLSFIYSFLFLGVLFTTAPHGTIYFPLALFGAQIIINTLTLNSFYLTSILTSIFLSFLFTLIFPMILLYYFFPNFLLGLITKYCLNLFLIICSQLHKYALIFNIMPDPMNIALVLSMLLFWKKRNPYAVIFLILIYSQNLTNLPRPYYLKLGKTEKIKTNVKQIIWKRTKKGLKYTQSGKTCYLHLANYGYLKYCWIK